MAIRQVAVGAIGRVQTAGKTTRVDYQVAADPSQATLANLVGQSCQRVAGAAVKEGLTPCRIGARLDHEVALKDIAGPRSV